ncbi:DEAD/DEAH box helicase [Candidatus Dojkabacteria bacterium]|uniref:DEAD/DEAH box helicase n=1 Tax=Candidatus Dojkabacteria bacterium TaxID=2099670 RepID=A0A955IAG1_9BACT|nr:DEAD/DEAH box helicase [Candidatus Dojkabacteria bacterium]
MKIIKTLRHLQPIFLGAKSTFYSSSLSIDVVETIRHSKLINKKDLKFSDLISSFTNLKSNTNTQNVIDDFKVGENLDFVHVDVATSELEFSIKGDIVTVWLPGYDFPIRAEFFDEDCEKITLIDPLTQRSIKEVDFIITTDYLPSDKGELETLHIDLSNHELDKIAFTDRFITEDINLYFKEEKLEIIETDFSFPPLFFSNKSVAKNEIAVLKSKGFKVLINSKRGDKDIQDVNLKFDSVNIKLDKEKIENLPAGFISNSNKIALFTDRELYGAIDLRSREAGIKSKMLQNILRQFEGDVSIGDYVVHEDYGIAIYAGLEQQVVEEVPNDYLLLKFADDDELYVPIDQISKITKYLSNEGSTPKLTRLGKKNWKEVKDKVKKTTFLTAQQLIKHYAKREASKSKAINKKDSDAYKAFVSKFDFEETPDQIRSINEVIADLEKDKPMNRLLVGDVGFGKTEVIMRASFKILENKGQVALLAPTTVLASQHYSVFTERFKDTKYKIGLVSRFNSVKENREIIDKANVGEIDILIGTHRLLSSDVALKNLELLVVDEEQKFGVRQKEKIKQINYGAHVLSVSATPIPRSLSLALSSIQDISIISTPPKGRLGVNTEIIFEDWKKSANAIQNEVSRGGQVYFVHNRVESIKGIESKIKDLVPNVSIAVAHGQMSPTELDRIFTDFYYKKYDILLSTTIIENGLDLPNVNTIIIHDAHKFGLSQLYQMRGRVGRSKVQGYCFLMAPKPSKEIIDQINADDQEALKSLLKSNAAKKANQKLYMQRLQSLVDNQDLGAGFRIASKDLEIRGAGNILGEQQHGHINTIGYALYIEMLADSIEQVKSSEEVVKPLL